MPEALYCAPRAGEDAAAARLIERAGSAGVPVHELQNGVIERVSDTVTPQPVLGVVPFVDVALETLPPPSLVTVCVDVRDPGNAGTVLRSAEAAGADCVVCCAGTVDVYNPKAVRSSAGALFGVPVVLGGDPKSVLSQLGGLGLRRVATASAGGLDYAEVDLTGPVAIVLGNEAAGLPDAVTGSVDELLTVPMHGRAESLNVGMAAAVVLFEAARQRGLASGCGPAGGC